MRKKAKRDDAKESKSLQTFFVYAFMVFFLIFLSFIFKIASIVQQSKFDDKHDFIVAISKQGKIQEIIGFHPAANSLAILQIKNSTIDQPSLGKTLGILPHAAIQINENVPLEAKIGDKFFPFLTRYNAIKTDLTIFDMIRLFLFSKNVPMKDTTQKEITDSYQNAEINNLILRLFKDEDVALEKATIQIINATDIPGLGNRLERVISNLGGNVVAVSTGRNKTKTSKVQYYGEETFTLEKLKKLFPFRIEKLEKRTISDITVIIGEDAGNTDKF